MDRINEMGMVTNQPTVEDRTEIEKQLVEKITEIVKKIKEIPSNNELIKTLEKINENKSFNKGSSNLHNSIYFILNKLYILSKEYSPSNVCLDEPLLESKVEIWLNNFFKNKNGISYEPFIKRMEEIKGKLEKVIDEDQKEKQ